MGAGHNSGWNALSCTLKILSTFLYVVILYVLKKKVYTEGKKSNTTAPGSLQFPENSKHQVS